MSSASVLMPGSDASGVISSNTKRRHSVVWDQGFQRRAWSSSANVGSYAVAVANALHMGLSGWMCAKAVGSVCASANQAHALLSQYT